MFDSSPTISPAAAAERLAAADGAPAASAAPAAAGNADAASIAADAPVPGGATAMSPQAPALAAFSAIGIGLEHVIVARDSLDPLPLADQMLAEAGGPGAGEVARGAYGWSHALALHQIETRNRTLAPSLAGLAHAFDAEVAAINRQLAPYRARLLPGGMHPWMLPLADTRLWPHAPAALHDQVDRIFDCRRHGWANVQGMRIHLPFSGDEQFARLHAAIRLVLPIIPALAASSPFAECCDTGHADYRIKLLRERAACVPGITGGLIPATVSSRAAYEQDILAPLYRAIALRDPKGLLQQEWFNPHGAIPCFARNAIEIRITDAQECPRADIAVAGAITAVVRMLYEEETCTLAQQQTYPTADLADILKRCTDRAEQAPLTGTACASYLALLGYPKFTCSAQHLWRYLLRSRAAEPGIDEDGVAALDQILEHGSLATRLRRATHGDISPARLHTLYRRLADCLEQGRMFGGQRVL